MTLKEKIMKLQTYKMFVGEDTVYVERDDVLKLLGQEPTTKNDLAVDFETQREFSGEFQNNLLDLFEICYKNHTDSCTVTFEYPNVVMEVDFTFRAEREDKE